MAKNLVLVIAGPTASGKSRLGIDLAKKIKGIIINCDAMQMYKDIPTLSAAPTPEELSEVEHRLFGIYDCNVRGNVVDWTHLCAKTIRNVWKQGKIPVVVGGTGLYMDSLLRGVSPIPPVSPRIRERVERMVKSFGLTRLHRRLSEIDFESACKISMHDGVRIARALEVFFETEKPISEWHRMPLKPTVPEAQFFVVKVQPSIEESVQRCYERLDKMINEQGAIAEVEKLFKEKIDEDMPAMKALGVPEILMYLRGEVDLSMAIGLAKLHTRQYVKRQCTWLKGKLQPDLSFTTAYCGQTEYVDKILNAINL